MTGVRKADRRVRRQVVLALVVGTCFGALLIVGFERYHIPLRDWILSEPGTSARRIRLVFLLLAVLLLAPMLAFAAYLWSLGGRVLAAQTFPPPGLRVIRDTPIITGEAAISRARLLKVLALGCGIISVVLGILLWRLVSLLSEHAG